MSDDDLDSLFADARAEPLRLRPGLTARVLADAEGLMVAPLPLALPRAPAARQHSGLWSALASAFGGGGALAGMVAATVAGFYIGFALPLDSGLVASVLGGAISEIDMMPGIDALLEEAP